jgi:Cof subfamily protein (haloacid dehalogenase superfamily)
MDGTLLNNNGELPKDFFKTLNALLARNVLFVAASGRQYFTLSDNFSAAKDKIVFAAENGSMVVHKGKELYSKTISKNIIHNFINDARKIQACNIVLCGKNSAYIESDEPEFVGQVKKYYHKNKSVKAFEDVQDEILKISIYDMKGSSNNSNKILSPSWEEVFQLSVSGDKWLDIGRKDMNKGVAIKFLQDKFGIKENETMVFGDNYNDIHMLQSAYHSYVMENAPEGVKKYGRFAAGSNNEDGVVQVIKDEVLEKYA